MTKLNPENAEGWIQVSRTLISRPNATKNELLQAIFAARRALTLDSLSISAWSWYARAGMAFGGADGERIAEDGWRRLLLLNPTSQEAWDQWHLLYHTSADRLRMRDSLAPWSDIAEVARRMAVLELESEHYPDALARIAALVAHDPANACVLGLKAQAEFESGADSAGYGTYQAAVRQSSGNSDCLWEQVVGIATPAEAAAYRGLSPANAPQFFRQFWAIRYPDLFESSNQRIAEHFHRLRIARKKYPLLHPLSAYNRSPIGRAAEAIPTIGEQLFYQRCEARVSPTAPVSSYDRARSVSDDTLGGFAWNPLYNPSGSLHADLASGRGQTRATQAPGSLYLDPSTVRLVSIPHSRTIRDVDAELVPVGYNLKTGLDDRGVAYLRWGPPDEIRTGSDNIEDPFCRLPDLERWEYPGRATIRFFRPNAIFVGLMGGVAQTGEIVMRPMGRRDFDGTMAIMLSDAPSQPAPLSFGFWSAQLRSANGQTELVVVSTRGAVRASLGGDEVAMVVEDSYTTLVAPPGPHQLVVHAAVQDSLGRQTANIRLRNFGGESVSDLVLAVSGGSSHVTRDSILGYLSRDLTYSPGQTIRAYAEIYDLDVANHGTYQATYQVYRAQSLIRDLRSDSLPGAVSWSFIRQAPSTSRVLAEWLDVSPVSLVPGLYVLRLEIRDVDGRRIGRSQATFRIR